jgi:hypothetical protein
VINKHGPIAASPPATVTIHFIRGNDHVEFDHCTAAIPLVGYHATETLSCTVSDGAWRNEEQSFTLTADVANPMWG